MSKDKIKSPSEYRADIANFLFVIGSLSFILISGFQLWFNEFYYYGWLAVGYVVISAILLEALAQKYTSYNGYGEPKVFFLSVVFIGFTFLFINPLMKSVQFVSAWETTKDKTYTKVVFYDGTQTIVNDEDGEILDLGQTTYYKMKHAITKKGSCTVVEKRKLKWNDNYRTDIVYCSEVK